MIKILPILAFEGLRGYQAFNRCVVLTLLMLPKYAQENSEEFLKKIELMPEENQRRIIREALTYVEMERSEVDYLLCLAADPNGVPYSRHSIKHMPPKEILAILEEVCFAFTKMNVDIITEEEKKNSEITL